MPRRKSTFTVFTIFVIRGLESLVVVAIATGVNVIQLFFKNPMSSPTAIWDEVYRAGNVFWVIISLLVLYTTNLDRPLLKFLRQFTEEESI